MRRVDDFRLRFGKRELVPVVIGGMGVDISNADLALEAARLGGIGHISDAMVQTVSDRRFDTNFVSQKLKKYKANVAGSDGITLSAGLHLNSFALIEDHPRFRDARLGIIVSSPRALAMFLRKNARLQRLPDFIVVEGPLAGGHLGFGLDWAQYDLATIFAEVLALLKAEHHDITVIPAGGIFTGSDAVGFLEHGAAAVQVATRFTVTSECGLPEKVKQEYFRASEQDIEVNTSSPTGYPMRMLKGSPGIGAGIRPNCEAYGYLLDANGRCAYIDAYNLEIG